MPTALYSKSWRKVRVPESLTMPPSLESFAEVPQRSGNKYKNRKTGKYASKKEHGRGQDLQLLERAGIIWDLKEQESFLLIPKQEGERACSYISDFTYWDSAGYHVEDIKSKATRKLPVFIIKRKLMLFLYQIRIEEL